MKKLFLLECWFIACLSVHAQVQVEGLRVEFLKDPVGIDVKLPWLSWYLTSKGHHVLQLAYEIRVAKEKAAWSDSQALVWRTGKVSSGESLHRTYAGEPLQAGRKSYWAGWGGGRTGEVVGLSQAGALHHGL